MEELIEQLLKIEQRCKNIREIYEQINMFMKEHKIFPCGHGDGRLVYRINDDYVLKLAYNAYGKKQNKKELRVFGKMKEDNLIAEILDGNENWIIMERLNVMDDEQFCNRCGLSFNMLHQFLFNNADVPENDVLRKIQKLIIEYKIDPYEIKSANFGVDNNNEVKMLDYGI